MELGLKIANKRRGFADSIARRGLLCTRVPVALAVGSIWVYCFIVLLKVEITAIAETSPHRSRFRMQAERERKYIMKGPGLA